MSNPNKRNIIICVVFGIVSIATMLIGLVIVPMFDEKGIEIGEEEFEATISSVSRVDKDYLIATNEYSCKLLVGYDVLVDKRADINLSTGEKIFFKLIKLENNPLNDPQIKQVFVVALRTQTDDIVTIDSYNAKQKESFQTIKMTALIASAISGVIAVVNLIVVVKNKNKRINDKAH